MAENILTCLFWICLLLVIYPYVIYPVILFLLTMLLPRYSLNQKDVNEQLPTVIILIAAYNEEATISEKIKNCLAIDYPSNLLHIWIASDGSTDKTNDIVKSFCHGESQIELLEFPRTGKSGILNKAMQYLDSDIVVFTDANVMLDRKILREFVKHFSNPAVGCVSSKLIRHNPNQVISGKGEISYWSYEMMIKKMESNLGYMAGTSGTAYAIRKVLFIPFHENTINDDFELSMGIIKKGYKSIYEDKAHAFEEVAPSLKSEFRRHIRDAAGHYIALLHLIGLLNPIYGIRFVVFLSHRVLRWIAPFMLVSLLVINILLFNQILFGTILAIQIIFYTLAIIGWGMSEKKEVPFWIYGPFYFCNLNAALIVGFWKAITGQQKTKWNSTERI